MGKKVKKQKQKQNNVYSGIINSRSYNHSVLGYETKYIYIKDEFGGKS